MQAFREPALTNRSWPMVEARKLLERLGGVAPAKGYVLFETGYGPSGLPHIGTFGEVARTSMVRHAFSVLSDIPTKLIAFSDDMDGMRKIPDGLPMQNMLQENLGKPLTAVPDPYEMDSSFGANMNNRLRQFLDRFGFEYEFYSATECYKSGMFDAALLKMLAQYEAVMNIMLPTLGEERQATYSPFLPICPETGVVLQVPILRSDVTAGTITYHNSRQEEVTVPVTGGHCKLQWKADWAMRWAALDVDYEMFGKDLIPTAELSAQIVSLIGGKPPVLFQYEHFLDESGQKISKSKGNGLTIDDWLRYAPQESLSLYMYQSPQKAKRLHFDVIPKHMDDYLTYLTKYFSEEPAQQLDNPVWHIHRGTPPPPVTSTINHSMLINLASACNPESASVLWGFISRYDLEMTPQSSPLLAAMVECALRYQEDHVKNAKHYREATREEIYMLKGMIKLLRQLPYNAMSVEILNKLYDLAAEYNYTDLKEFFKTLYQLLLGQDAGPRWGSFIAIYGLDNTIHLLERTIAKSNFR
jgi:lysyl-tRNA synthetase class 1